MYLRSPYDRIKYDRTIQNNVPEVGTMDMWSVKQEIEQANTGEPQIAIKIAIKIQR